MKTGWQATTGDFPSRARDAIERINNKMCFPASGVIYLDVLSDLERIADHATNIAEVVSEHL